MVAIIEKEFESYDIKMGFSISALVLESGTFVCDSNPEHFNDLGMARLCTHDQVSQLRAAPKHQR